MGLPTVPSLLPNSVQLRVMPADVSRHAVAIVGRLADVPEEKGDFRF
jgi:hypothetical protein